MITPRVNLETQSFTYVSRNTGKEELVNLNENQLNALRAVSYTHLTLPTIPLV